MKKLLETRIRNEPEDFPELREKHLKIYAQRWVKKYKDVPIESIILYRCHSVWHEYLTELKDSMEMKFKAPTKYALIFNVSMGLEDYRDFLIDTEYFKDHQSRTPFLSFLDSVFPQRVYKEAFLPEGDFRDEWIIQPKTPNDEFYRNVMTDEPYWILYDHSGLQAEQRPPEQAPDDILEKNEVATNHYVFRQTGPTWNIIYQGAPLEGLKGKGFEYIHFLVKNPNTSYHTNDIAIEVDKTDPYNLDKLKKVVDDNTGNSDYDTKKGKGFDHRDMVYGSAKDKLNKKWNDLKKELQEAEENNDLGRIEKAREGLEDFEEHYFKMVQPNGKSRKFIDETKRTMKRITISIDRALKEIKKYNEVTYSHFFDALKPIHSEYLSYTPDQDIDWLA